MSKSKAQTGRPLDGIRVLDFSHAAAAPFATMFLGDLGAQIIKIEKPKQGDGSRSMGVPMPAMGPKDSDYYISLNRNKKGLVIDLAQPEGAGLARDLAAKCDVVVENFRPGVMARLGLAFEDLAKVRPGLIYCSISAFGATGPWSQRPANDIIVQSVSGLMGITGEVRGGPVRIGAPICDFSSGLFGLSGILAALFARDRFPEGQHIEVAMLDASLNMMCNYIPSVATLGAKVERLGRGHAQIVPYQAFMCADGEYVMVGAFTREFWWNLCRALGRQHWIEDPRFATNSARLRNTLCSSASSRRFSPRARAWSGSPCSKVPMCQTVRCSSCTMRSALSKSSTTAPCARSIRRASPCMSLPARCMPHSGRKRLPLRRRSSARTRAMYCISCSVFPTTGSRRSPSVR